MEESVRPSSTVNGTPQHIDLQSIPLPPQRGAGNAAAVDTTSARPPYAAWESRYRAWVVGSDVFTAFVLILMSAFLIDRSDPHDMHALGTAAAFLFGLSVCRACVSSRGRKTRPAP